MSNIFDGEPSKATQANSTFIGSVNDSCIPRIPTIVFRILQRAIILPAAIWKDTSEKKRLGGLSEGRWSGRSFELEEFPSLWQLWMRQGSLRDGFTRVHLGSPGLLWGLSEIIWDHQILAPLCSRWQNFPTEIASMRCVSEGRHHQVL